MVTSTPEPRRGPKTRPNRRPRSRPRPGILTHDEIFRAGLDLVDAEGLESLTMRRLAEVLDVGTMTLYRYVSTKDEIFEGVSAMVLAKLKVDLSVDGQWHERMTAAMTDIYNALREHPAAIDLLSAAPTRSPVLDHMRDGVLRLLRTAGFGEDEATDAISSLYCYVVGSAVIARTRQDTATRKRSTDDPGQALVSRLHPVNFDYGLALVIDGLRSRLT